MGPALLAVLALATAAAPPRHGVLVPGESLGGIRLGATAADVRRAWGRAHGVCVGCPVRTWYFTYERFTQPGAAVELRHGRVQAVYTLWSPAEWRSTGGLVLGAPEADVTATAGLLERVECGTYAALVRRGRDAVTAYYVVDGRLWGFGLGRPDAPVCR
jgi:hypothetical protein